ncbi:GAF and ANTAR domain-containing protein [Amycolatopsis sp. NBC_01488]|uniref:GAF and ANTAR domain-containing protein n=1 Tax=Amycolatopsis sp. NBC_01488 TaxID=2903563 RepID=UPI002E2B2D74|nr:GAF and ANTAR domain-containing protein [Amycolatopsis sp. NBC_01488]
MDQELPPSEELAAVFARMSGLLLTTDTAGSALRAGTTLAQEIFPDTAGAGMSLLDEDGTQITTAATGEVVERADRLQYELRAGPCLTAWADRTVVRVDDLARDPRWPDWARRAARELGLRASLSVPVVAGDTALGALKVYATRPGAYREREESLLALFAAQAAMLVANAKSHADARRVSARLRDSLRGRDVVNIAKGVLMSRGHVDEQTAFLQLADLARERRHSLRDAAEDLVRTTLRRRR